jgi:hypothetical protein
VIVDFVSESASDHNGREKSVCGYLVLVKKDVVLSCMDFPSLPAVAVWIDVRSRSWGAFGRVLDGNNYF